MTQDIAIFPATSGLAVQTIIPTREDTSLITGISKLTQKFVMRLLTAAKSMPFLPAEGCILPKFVKNGRLVNESDVHSAFSVSLLQLRSLFDGDTDADTPLDEQLSTASI